MIRLWLGMLGLAMALGAQPKGPLRPKLGPRARQARQFERFTQMTPEERKQVLDELPEARRRRVEEGLRRYENLTPEQRERIHHNLESFQSLPPEKQSAARRLFRQMNEMPAGRRQAMRGEIAHLRRLNEDERNTRVHSQAFRNRYTAEEQKILEELSTILPPEE